VSAPGRAMAFVMDPIQSLDIRADTTFALMLEAQRRGHRVFAVDPGDLGVESGRVLAKVFPVTLRREVGRHADVGEPRLADLDAEMDLVFQRKDPPVDESYVTATQILALLVRALVWNRPAGILAANEKLYALHFADLMPETLVARESARFLDFMDRMGGEMILKPLGGRGGEGIFHVRRDDRNLYSMLEQTTRFGTRLAMAQRYLPEVRGGDKRILLIDGEPRANLHVGGRPQKASVDEADRRILARLRPWLLRDGLHFVGIDVIGGRLTEVNVTSPTGIQEMNALDGARYEERVLERIEAALAERG
jgi:glutathione synthase